MEFEFLFYCVVGSVWKSLKIGRREMKGRRIIKGSREKIKRGDRVFIIKKGRERMLR